MTKLFHLTYWEAYQYTHQSGEDFIISDIQISSLHAKTNLFRFLHHLNHPFLCPNNNEEIVLELVYEIYYFNSIQMLL